MKKDHLLPLKVRPVPPFRSHDPEGMREELHDWFKHAEDVREENRRRFDKALPRIALCAFLKGFTFQSGSEHFSWCPREEWMRHQTFTYRVPR